LLTGASIVFQMSCMLLHSFSDTELRPEILTKFCCHIQNLSRIKLLRQYS